MDLANAEITQAQCLPTSMLHAGSMIRFFHFSEFERSICMDEFDPVESGKLLYKQLVGLKVKFYQRNQTEAYAYVNDIIWDLHGRKQIDDLLRQVGIRTTSIRARRITYYTLQSLAQLLGEQLTDFITSALPEWERPKVKTKHRTRCRTYPHTYARLEQEVSKGNLPC
jgi:hypothetical protein